MRTCDTFGTQQSSHTHLTELVTTGYIKIRVIIKCLYPPGKIFIYMYTFFFTLVPE